MRHGLPDVVIFPYLLFEALHPILGVVVNLPQPHVTFDVPVSALVFLSLAGKRKWFRK